MKVEGIAEVVKQKEDPKRFIVLLNGQWYSKFGNVPEGISQGDYLKIEFDTTEEGYRNITRSRRLNRLKKS